MCLLQDSLKNALTPSYTCLHPLVQKTFQGNSCGILRQEEKNRPPQLLPFVCWDEIYLEERTLGHI